MFREWQKGTPYLFYQNQLEKQNVTKITGYPILFRDWWHYICLDIFLMPRKKLIRTNEYPYHITARTNNKEWFSLSLDQCWEIFSLKIQRTIKDYQVDVHALVLMANHFHLLLSTPCKNLGEAMNYLIRETSKTIGRKSGRTNHIFGGPYKWSLVTSDRYFAHTYRYIYQNPVRASVVNKVEDYAHSTIYFSAKNRDPGFMLIEPTEFFYYVPNKLEERIAWLNQCYPTKHNAVIKHALRRKIFQFSDNRRTQVPDIT